MMCLEICNEMNIGSSIMFLRIYDEIRFISMEFANYCKEYRIEREFSIMPSCTNSCGKKRLCYMVT
jgi:hypothetical protein